MVLTFILELEMSDYQVDDEGFVEVDIDEVPDYQLDDHQEVLIQGMEKLENNESRTFGIRGGILAAKMGLGKTIICLHYTINHPVEEDGYNLPTLILVEKSLMGMMKEEGVKKFFGDSLKVIYLHKDFCDVNRVTLEDVKGADLVITTYDVCLGAFKKNERVQHSVYIYNAGQRQVGIMHRTLPPFESSGIDVIYGMKWGRVFADESQRFANPKTKLFAAMMGISSVYRWCMSGTPIQNYDTDIWAQLRFCGYNAVTSKNEWKRKGYELYKAHNLIRFMLQMDYQKANITLPRKHVHPMYLDFTPEEKQAYEIIRRQTIDEFMKLYYAETTFSSILALLIRLRQACVALNLTVTNTTGENESWITDINGTAGIKSSKFMAAVNIIQNIPPTEKVVVFCTFAAALDLMNTSINYHLPGVKVLQIDGDTPQAERESSLKLFKSNDEYRVLLMTYKVGSKGLNLTEATHCICLDQWWNSSVIHQAEARIWRRGQTREVHTYRLFANASIELHMATICSGKLEMADSYTENREKPKVIRMNKQTIWKILNKK
jgi:SNF2 family DNA or RNA helicase